MRFSRLLLLVSAVTGLVSVLAALFSMGHASLQYGLVMLLSVVAYVVVAGRAAVRRVRWTLIAGIGALAVVMATRLFWYHDPAADAGWLTYGHGGQSHPVLEQWRGLIERERIAAVGLLLGVLCLAVGVLMLPARHRARRGMLTTILALLLLAMVGLEVGSGFGRAPTLDLLGAAWPALLGILVAVGAVALSGWRADRAWLLPVGSLLLAMAAITAFYDLAGAWSAWWEAGNPREDAFLAVGVRVSTGGFPQVSAALETAVALAGPALVAIGALHSSRNARPV